MMLFTLSSDPNISLHDRRELRHADVNEMLDSGVHSG